MADLSWITPAGDLGLIPESEFYKLDLSVSNLTTDTVTFRFISGELPPGIQVTRDGALQGAPVVTEDIAQNRTYSFTVRAQITGVVADRTFSLTITNVSPPQILPDRNLLGSFFDGTFVSVQLIAIEANPEADIQWVLESGNLPPGISLSSTGLISGYILPLPVRGNAGQVGYEAAFYEQFGYNHTATYQNASYNFTIRASDGANFDSQPYRMDIIAKSNWSADNVLDLINNTYLTVDFNDRYVPLILTPAENLPEIRGGSNFAFKIDAIDPEGSEIQYTLVTQESSGFDVDGTGFDTTVEGVVGRSWVDVNPDPAVYDWQQDSSVILINTNNFDQPGLALPPGLTIDSATGWITGEIPEQLSVREEYVFQVVVSRVDEPEFRSDPRTFTLTVLGNINNTITWLTPTDLGTIDNGDTSEFSVQARSNAGKQVTYFLCPQCEFGQHLPQGLRLLPSGLIVGRASFQHFQLDAGDTTLDGGDLTFNNTYQFTVVARTVDTISDRGVWQANTEYFVNDVITYVNTRYICVADHVSGTEAPTAEPDLDNWVLYGTVVSRKSFRIRVNNFNTKPYENLFIQSLPRAQERALFLEIVNNRDIFPEELIYRASDPWFGRARSIDSLFLPGINPHEASDYVNAMAHNHFWKNIDFGTVKTARALDENFQVKYEVVYLDLLDRATNLGRSPADQQNLTGLINPWYDAAGNAYTVAEYNSFQNMQRQIVNDLGFARRGMLPDWMTGTQENGRVLGFVNAVVLAYTVPGASKLIAYRLKTQGLKFNDIEFKLDRYHLDNHLSEHYDITAQAFEPGSETTFDRVQSVGMPEHQATFAVMGVPFDNIHDQPMSVIQEQGYMDGSVFFNDGDTLIFAQQSNFQPSARYPSIVITPNDGWNLDGSVIPGYTENLLNPEIPNQRAGKWTIRIVHQQVGDDLVPYVRLESTNGYDRVDPWTASKIYSVGEVALYQGVVYRATKLHTSSADFAQDRVLLNSWEVVPEIDVTERVQISRGYTFSQRIMYYDSVLKPDRSVPEYTAITSTVSIGGYTTFDKTSTRFFSNRDTYAEPRVNDKYLKFLKIGVFK